MLRFCTAIDRIVSRKHFLWMLILDVFFVIIAILNVIFSANTAIVFPGKSLLTYSLSFLVIVVSTGTLLTIIAKNIAFQQYRKEARGQHHH